MGRYFGQGQGINGLAVAKVTAGWIVKRYDPSMDAVDMIAGAFSSPAQAVDAARAIIDRELDDLLFKLQATEHTEEEKAA